MKGDALARDSIVAAAEGADTIVHAVNPPAYKNWAALVVPMIENTITAAKTSGARILLPGTIYNYGPDAFPIFREDSPQHATTHKGTIRIELEKRMQEAVADRVHSLIVRFGDFFGPKSGQSWFSQGMVKPNQLPCRRASGEKVVSRAVICATGVEYRRLGLPSQAASPLSSDFCSVTTWWFTPRDPSADRNMPAYVPFFPLEGSALGSARSESA